MLGPEDDIPYRDPKWWSGPKDKVPDYPEDSLLTLVCMAVLSAVCIYGIAKFCQWMEWITR